MAEKFPGITPYAFAGNNPVLLNDPNGEDWTIPITIEEDGTWKINFNFKAQVLNSSKNKSIDARKIAESATIQFENLFKGSFKKDGDSPAMEVTATADITAIDKKEDLAKDATLIDIRDDNDKAFDIKDPNVHPSGIALTGKLIAIKQSYINDFFHAGMGELGHEIGHTGGLWHPHDDQRHTTGVQLPFRYNPSNFMNWPGKIEFWTSRNRTGVTRDQVMRIFKLYSHGQLNTNTWKTHPLFKAETW
jgi:hypothetical protein